MGWKIMRVFENNELPGKPVNPHICYTESCKRPSDVLLVFESQAYPYCRECADWRLRFLAGEEDNRAFQQHEKLGWSLEAQAERGRRR